MEIVLTTPDLKECVFRHLSNQDKFNLSVTNKSIQCSVSEHSYKNLMKYVGFFEKRISKIIRDEEIIHYVRYMSLFNYYSQIREAYLCLKDKQLFKTSSFVFRLNHVHIPLLTTTQELITIKDVMERIYVDGCPISKIYKSGNPSGYHKGLTVLWYKSKLSNAWIQSHSDIWSSFVTRLTHRYS